MIVNSPTISENFPENYEPKYDKTLYSRPKHFLSIDDLKES